MGACEPTVLWSPQPGPQTALLECPVFEVFYDGAALRTFRGGAQINSKAQTGTIVYDSTTLDINGRGNGLDTANKISVPLICLWDRALTLDEVNAVTHTSMQLFEHLRTVI